MLPALFLRCPAIARPACCATMASLRVLSFDHEDRPIHFHTWLYDLQLHLLSDYRDSVSLFDHTSGATPAPPATADSATRSQWLTRDATARLAICNHLPLAECAHLGQHRTAQALYDAFVARYSSPATAALGCLLLPHLFPKLSAFATVEDLVSHLRTSDARYRAALPEEFLAKNPPLMGVPPPPLPPSYASAATVDVLGAEDVGAAFASGKGGKGGGGGSGGGGGGSSGGGGGRGSGGGGGGFGGGGGGTGGGGGSGGSGSGGGRAGVAHRGGFGGGQRQQQQRWSKTPSPKQLREWLFQHGASGGSGSCPYVIRTGDRAGQTCGKPHTQHCCFSCLDDAWSAEFGDEAERLHWVELLRNVLAIFYLDFDAILAAIYALYASAEGDCYMCVPPNPRIKAAALGASKSVLPGTAPVEALQTFTLDSGASRYFFRDSTTLTPLSAPVPVRLADPSGGPVLARSSTVLPCLAVPSGSQSGLHLPSFSTSMVSTAALQDAMVTTITSGGQRVSICTCTRTGCHLAIFTRRPWSTLYILATELPQVALSAHVSALGQVAPPYSCHLLSHQTLLWHHRLGHPSLPRLRGMHSRLLVSGLPRSLPPLPPSPLASCLPCIEGRQRATPHSSSFPPTTAPLETLHMDVTDLLVLRLHSDRGGEFSSDLLRDFCHGEGILESLTLPDSPQQNGIAEHRIGLVMEVARTSMIHAAAPHFLWRFVVWYVAHQLNLWPLVSLPETSPTMRWTGKVGDASVFRVWGSRAFVRDTSADKLFARAIPCVFLGFSPDALGWQFYHPTSRCVFPSHNVTFDQTVPFYRLLPYRSAPPPPPSLFLAPGPPPVDPLPPEGLAPSGVSQVDPLPGTAPVHLGGAGSEGAGSGGAEPEGAESEGAWFGGAELGCVEPAGVEPGGAEPEHVESGGDEQRGTASSGGLAAAGAGVSAARDTGAGGAGVTAGAGGSRGASAAGPGGARTGGNGAAGAGGVGGAGAGDPTEPAAARAVGSGARGTGAGGAGAGGAGGVDPGAWGDGGMCGRDPSPLPAPSPYNEQTRGLTKRCEPASRPASPVCTGRRVPRPRPPPVRGTHAMALCPSSIPLRVPLPPPPKSSLPAPPDPESDRARVASPTVSRLLTTVVIDPSFESTTASALVAELLDFAAACCLDYAIALVAESDLRQPVYGLRQTPREWHDTLRTTLVALGFTTSTADPSLFLRTDMSLPPFYVLVYVDDLDFATGDTGALTLVNSELQKRNTCTDLGPSALRLPQRGQLRLAYVATRANSADIFTKALPPGDHQRFSTVLGLLALLFLTGLVTA
ncbi:unnamed protein product [Closterium sp. NIES-53]